MTPLVVALLGAFVAVLCTGREANANAKTWTELWQPARANGWRRSTILAVGGTLKLLLLLVGGVTALTLDMASRSAGALSLVCGALAWHLRSVTTYAASPPPRLAARVTA